VVLYGFFYCIIGKFLERNCLVDIRVSHAKSLTFKTIVNLEDKPCANLINKILYFYWL